MKSEMRHKLAQLPFEEKIRKVSELILLPRKVKNQRVREDASNYAGSRFRKVPVRLGPKSDPLD
jgi:hypothetical protein